MKRNHWHEVRLTIGLVAAIVLGLMLFGSVELEINITKKSSGIIQTVTQIADGAVSIYRGMK